MRVAVIATRLLPASAPTANQAARDVADRAAAFARCGGPADRAGVTESPAAPIAGANFGLPRAAADLTVFTGVSSRF